LHARQISACFHYGLMQAEVFTGARARRRRNLFLGRSGARACAGRVHSARDFSARWSFFPALIAVSTVRGYVWRVSYEGACVNTRWRGMRSLSGAWGSERKPSVR
jgi:hypothetical protein